MAKQIREQAAQDLGGMAAAVARSLAFTDRAYRLAFSGGVLQHQAALRDAVCRYLDQYQLTPLATAVVEEPVVAGAVGLDQRPDRACGVIVNFLFFF